MRIMTVFMLIPLAAVFAQSPTIQGHIEQLDRELCAEGSRLLHVNTDSRGATEYYAVSLERLAATPEWDGSGHPPLDLNTALDYARKRLEMLHPGHISYSFTQGRIFPIENNSYSNRWCYEIKYQVEFKATEQIDRASLGTITFNDQPIKIPEDVSAETRRYVRPSVFILMDGTSIEPKQMGKK